MKRYFLVISLILMSVIVLSHEFWLQPVKFLLAINEKTRINIFVGEGFKGEKADASKYKVVRLKHFSVSGEEDFSGNIDAKDQSAINVAFSKAGNHLVAFNNSNKFISLKSTEFNAYLREEGLDNVFEMRVAANDTSKDGHEVYQRCVKTLFLAGNKSDSSYKINTGMRLELIPSANPYAIKTNDQLSFTVYFDSKPVSNSMVLAWNVVNGKTMMTKYRTSPDGSVTFPVSRKGRWMISTVRMVPHTDKAEADWQSYWSSYTFGYY